MNTRDETRAASPPTFRARRLQQLLHSKGYLNVRLVWLDKYTVLFVFRKHGKGFENRYMLEIWTDPMDGQCSVFWASQAGKPSKGMEYFDLTNRGDEILEWAKGAL